MTGKKFSSTKNQTAKTKDATLHLNADRENRILNSMANTSVILMSTMMGAFTQGIVSMTGAMASGMADALGGKEAGDQVGHEIKQKLPQVDEKMSAMISDIKKDIYSQIGQKKLEFEPLLSDPAFEVGPKIIEKYDFKLPKLTQEIDDNTLTRYSQLLVNGDIQFVEMFKELTEWLGSLPKPLGTNQEKNGKHVTSSTQTRVRKHSNKQ
ncbi:MAG: hypothetical protein ACXV2C_06905 [Candidatus Bathyarchaeia archaeon]